MIIRSLALPCLVAFMMVLASLQGHAQQTTATSNIAAIEFERLIQSSLAHQSIQQQLIALHDRIQVGIDSDKAELVEMDRELTMQRTILAPEAYEEKRRQFDERVAVVRDRVNELNQRIEKAGADATGEIQQALFVIISELAEQRGYVAVLPTSTMVYASPSTNITAEVQQQLDARLPRVEVQFSEQ